jgi:hypothetical protein
MGQVSTRNKGLLQLEDETDKRFRDRTIKYKEKTSMLEYYIIFRLLIL